MTQWLGHIVLHSMGLLAAGLLALVIRGIWRKDPIASYRFLVLLLVSTCSLPLAQLAIQGRGHNHSRVAQALAPFWFTEETTALASPNAAGPRSLALAEPLSSDAAPAATADPLNLAWGPWRVFDDLELKAIPNSTLPSEHRADVKTIRSSPQTPAFSPIDDNLGLIPTPQETADLQLALVPDPGGLSTHVNAESARDENATATSIPRGIDWSALASKYWLYAYCLVVALLALRQLLRFARTSRLIHKARPVQSEDILNLWESLKGEFPIAKKVRLKSSWELSSPACWGVFFPCLVLPGGDDLEIELSPQKRGALEWALRHELVHLTRGDTKTAMLQALVTSFFWFHPVAWWLSAQLNRLRELSCDLLVVQDSGNRKSYALALLDYAQQQTPLAKHNNDPSWIPGPRPILQWSGHQSELKRRIKMLQVSQSKGRGLNTSIPFVSAALIFAILWSSQLAIAATLIPQTQEEPGELLPAADALISVNEIPVSKRSLPEELAADSTPEIVMPDSIATSVLEASLICDPPKLGIYYGNISSSDAKRYNLNKKRTMKVTGLVKNGFAKKAGVRAGDIITHIDGKSATRDTLRARLKKLIKGGILKLDIQRAGRTLAIDVPINMANQSPFAGSRANKEKARSEYLAKLEAARAAEKKAAERTRRADATARRKAEASRRWRASSGGGSGRKSKSNPTLDPHLRRRASGGVRTTQPRTYARSNSSNRKVTSKDQHLDRAIKLLARAIIEIENAKAQSGSRYSQQDRALLRTKNLLGAGARSSRPAGQFGPQAEAYKHYIGELEHRIAATENELKDLTAQRKFTARHPEVALRQNKLNELKAAHSAKKKSLERSLREYASVKATEAQRLDSLRANVKSHALAYQDRMNKRAASAKDKLALYEAKVKHYKNLNSELNSQLGVHKKYLEALKSVKPKSRTSGKREFGSEINKIEREIKALKKQIQRLQRDEKRNSSNLEREVKNLRSINRSDLQAIEQELARTQRSRLSSENKLRSLDKDLRSKLALKTAAELELGLSSPSRLRGRVGSSKSSLRAARRNKTASGQGVEGKRGKTRTKPAEPTTPSMFDETIEFPTRNKPKGRRL